MILGMAMRLQKVLCGSALAIAGLLALVFLLDLAIKIPFGRFSWSTDVLVVLASALIIWQGLETWKEL
jgi:hypothetical protein